jgi:6,7-dimethyl-8-ribityllumazine synthase
MITTYEGKLQNNDGKIAIVSARFNSFIVERLVEGAIDALKRHNFDEEQIEHYKVPGAFEMPVITKKILESGQYVAVIALGAVIRGATPHFDYVSAEVSKGLANLSINYTTPLGFGVLTTDNIDQAIERAGSKAGNKGYEAAMTVIEMIDLFNQI